MLAFLQTQTRNQQLAKDIEVIFSMVEVNKMTEEEAFGFINEAVTKSYMQGASWAPA